ncbi:lysoplasmalogenase family protein [Lachnoclostridium sp.]|uniref:lysoplasmalogenase family protein n=1 Tax=Lachnoclostridium sp. TaxID=2028282 RepID=UPI0028A112E4|nr:lysoplasmalogenase family protein [Lachnoclostridium sp.]
MDLIQPLFLFVLYSILFTFLMLATISLKYKKYYVIVKTINSIGFLAVSIFCAYYGANIRTLIYLLPALLLCFIGDVVLGFYNATIERDVKETNTKVTGKPSLFIMGLLTFAFGHVCFIYAFSIMQKVTWVDMIFPILAIFITIGLTRLDKMNTGKLTKLIVAYSFMVAMLFSKGMHLVLSQFSIQNLLLSIGATLFLISDTFILFLYFYEKKYKAVHVINLATYYYGMFFIGLSLLY